MLVLRISIAYRQSTGKWSSINYRTIHGAVHSFLSKTFAMNTISIKWISCRSLLFSIHTQPVALPGTVTVVVSLWYRVSSNFRRVKISRIAVWKGSLQFIFMNSLLVIYIGNICNIFTCWKCIAQILQKHITNVDCLAKFVKIKCHEN